MSHPHTITPRWISVPALSLTVAAVPTIAPVLAPRDIRAVKASQVALGAESAGLITLVARYSRESLSGPNAASTRKGDPAPSDFSIVIDDFSHGGLAQVILHELTSRTTDPHQLPILHDFFQGGVIQMVRNRLLDATSSPQQRAAIIAFFPDEVTDYRGGPIDVVQRRLIAAAKGNPAVKTTRPRRCRRRRRVDLWPARRALPGSGRFPTCK